jgi:hypothetical protein
MGANPTMVDTAVLVYAHIETKGEDAFNSKRLLNSIVSELSDEEFDRYCQETDEFDRCNHVTPLV